MTHQPFSVSGGAFDLKHAGIDKDMYTKLESNNSSCLLGWKTGACSTFGGIVWGLFKEGMSSGGLLTLGPIRQDSYSAHLIALPAAPVQAIASSAATNCFELCDCISYRRANMDVCCGGRRLTVPLVGSGEATLSKLMKDDDEYTFSELPRINPHYKVCVSCLSCML